jgi:hypothetical protein
MNAAHILLLGSVDFALWLFISYFYKEEGNRAHVACLTLSFRSVSAASLSLKEINYLCVKEYLILGCTQFSYWDKIKMSVF